MRRRDALSVQLVADCGKRQSPTPHRPYAASKSRRNRLRPTEPDSLLLLHGQCLTSALGDQPALELCEDSQYIRHRLSCWRGRVHRAIKSYERPSFLLRLRHHWGEVEHRAREAVKLRDHERIRTPPLKLLQSGTHPRAPLHPIVSRNVLLLNYTRRSGSRRTIPVQYAHQQRAERLARPTASISSVPASA